MPRVWPTTLVAQSCDRYVLISGNVATGIDEFLAVDPGECEAGGILLGYRRDPHIEIVDATFPSNGDVRRPLAFTRQSATHQRIAKRVWRNSGQLIDYVGEWHTHPEPHPLPSRLDRDELCRRSCQHRFEALVELIIGSRSVYAALAAREEYSRLAPVGPG